MINRRIRRGQLEIDVPILRPPVALRTGQPDGLPPTVVRTPQIRPDPLQAAQPADPLVRRHAGPTVVQSRPATPSPPSTGLKATHLRRGRTVLS
ncbi:hypothetical protein Aau02nite_30710 [Amorphoplanes auranticolor]|uniref:Uncharacterized protein n=1 Tax=Actinoplanes auranticolor TaxID=47988 RepID=A0A919S9P7_9ACTN|nr:hypothetical protein Aau02nite_30710 [Actinoplanes auranticolor]